MHVSPFTEARLLERAKHSYRQEEPKYRLWVGALAWRIAGLPFVHRPVKAGDAASLGVLAELDSDEVREGLGKLLVDGKAYDIEKGVIRRRSVIVTTILGVGEEQTFTKGGAAAARSAAARATTDPAKITSAIADREIQFLPMGPDPTDLRAFVRFFLEAAGKIPPT